MLFAIVNAAPQSIPTELPSAGTLTEAQGQLPSGLNLAALEGALPKSLPTSLPTDLSQYSSILNSGSLLSSVATSPKQSAPTQSAPQTYASGANQLSVTILAVIFIQ